MGDYGFAMLKMRLYCNTASWHGSVTFPPNIRLYILCLFGNWGAYLSFVLLGKPQVMQIYNIQLRTCCYKLSTANTVWIGSGTL